MIIAEASVNALNTSRDSGDATPPSDFLNMAYEDVDRHLEDGLGNAVAMRFLKRSDSPATIGDLYTYRRLASESNRFANVLAALAVQRGQTVFVLCPRVPASYVAVLGALKGGHVVCPLFAAFGPEPIRQRLAVGEAAVLVTSKALYERKIVSIRDQLAVEHVILIDGDDVGELPRGTQSFHVLMEAASDTFRVADTTADSPALLHFTSGTTGTPKGAVHVHGALSMQRRSTRSVLGVQPGDVYWCTADPGWVTGTSYGILGPLAVGATTIVDEAEFDAERWYQLLDAQHVTVWYTAPTAIRMLMRAGADCAHGHDLSFLRSAFSVGEPLNADAVKWGIDELGITFRDTWWQTETGSIMIANPYDGEVRPGSMGRAVDGITATLLATDDAGELVRDANGRVMEISEPNMVGMIALRIGWSSMFRAYLNAPDRYARAFADGWYLSGDLARRDADGCFWFVGRADDVIKTAGHLIGPFEIESVLNMHPDVIGSGVYGVPDAVSGNAIHACVVVREGVVADARLLADVMAHARRRLGAALAPRQIVPVERLPLTRSGKVMRRLLQARELDLPEGDPKPIEVNSSDVIGALVPCNLGSKSAIMRVHERSNAMSDLDSNDMAFDGPEASVLTYVTTEGIVTIAPTATVRAAATAIVDQSVGMLVIGTTDDVLAVLSERDIVRAVAQGHDLDRTSVLDIGSREIVWIDADDSIGEAAEEMMKDYVRHALVRDETGLVGVVSMRDVLSAYTT